MPRRTTSKGSRAPRRATRDDKVLAELRRKIAIGLEQLDRGQTVDGEAAFRELLRPLSGTESSRQ